MNEKLLQEYLDGRSPVSEAYQAAEKSGPPPELDRAVLAEARAAARTGRDDGSPRWQNWLMPVSLAATVTLCIALVTEIVVLDPLLRSIESPQTYSDALEAEADAPAASPATAGRLSSEQVPMRKAPQLSADSIEAKQEPTSADDEIASTVAMPAEEAPALATEVQTGNTRTVPEPRSDRPISESQRAVQKDSAGGMGAMSATVQPAMGSAGEQMQSADDFDQGSSESAVVLGGASGAASMGGMAGASGSIEDIAVTARSRTDGTTWPAPDVWLAGIRVLLEQGEQERAEAELDKFREVYPDFSIGNLVQGTDED